MEHRWNETDRGKPKYSGDKPIPVPLCPPQIPHGLIPGSNPGLRGEKPATNRLSHGTALLGLLKYCLDCFGKGGSFPGSLHSDWHNACISDIVLRQRITRYALHVHEDNDCHNTMSERDTLESSQPEEHVKQIHPSMRLYALIRLGTSENF
jgi:hypothetical protein